jgi:hypothetical protein
MKFELEKFYRNTDEKDLLEDLKKAYHLLKKQGLFLTFRSYNEIGKYSSATMVTRFGSWNNALASAKIEVNEEKNISDKDLFLNLEQVWTALGRQPVTRDLIKPLSKYTHQTYSKRFGGWRKALEAFVHYINENEDNFEPHDDLESQKGSSKIIQKIRTKRNISDRMRFKILSRDGFTCQSCGASPIKKRGVELHVDHIIPWSKGGETVEENLQTKCKQCNLGKGNAFNQ